MFAEFKETDYCKSHIAHLERRKFNIFVQGVNGEYTNEQTRERIEEVDDIITELTND